jgi:cystathionine beta-lyase family protein involved in aluminum resistance
MTPSDKSDNFLSHVQVDCNLLDEIEEIEEKRTPKKIQSNQQTSSAGYSYDDSDGAIIAPPVTATISKQESNEVREDMKNDPHEICIRSNK